MKHRRSANIPCSTAHTFLVSMASLLSLSFLVLFIGLSHSSASHLRSPPRHPNIREACKATRFSELCEKSLSKSPSLPPRASAMEVIQASVSVSSQNLRTARSMVNDILRASAGNLNRTNAAKTCLEVLRNSDYRISSTLRALPRGRLTDARSWMSAALAYQYDCWSGLKYVNGTRQVSKTMSFFESVIASSSNALSMMAAYAVSGNDVASWAQPRTERVGFWEVESGSGDELGFNGGVPPGLSANVTVCKEEGKRCFRTVQKAVDAAPANLTAGKFVIHIKAGVYKETVRVPLEKTNLVFLGDGMGKTIITGSANVGQPGMSTYNSATVGVVGDGFMAEGLTIENTAGSDAHQAVAFRSDSDRSVLQNCEFTGNQDTLYAHSLRQFYRSCRITGNVDFIFGNAAALFQNCTILVAPRQLHPEKGENNAITAHGRTDPAQRTGFVFQGCLVNGTAEYVRLYLDRPAKHRNYLGRPWKEFSRSVFIRCVMEALIAPEGWMPWDKDFALETLYYGEFGNSGPGANLTGRVRWSSRVPQEHAGSYSVRNFIQGDEWIPPLFPGSV